MTEPYEADPYTEFYDAFFTDHPEALAGVKVVAGERVFSADTMRQFIAWALANGLVIHEDRALAWLVRLPELVAEAPAAVQHPALRLCGWCAQWCCAEPVAEARHCAQCGDSICPAPYPPPGRTGRPPRPASFTSRLPEKVGIA